MTEEERIWALSVIRDNQVALQLTAIDLDEAQADMLIEELNGKKMFDMASQKWRYWVCCGAYRRAKHRLGIGDDI